MMQNISEFPNEQEFTTLMQSTVGSPCWSCAETDYSESDDTRTAIVPIVNISNSTAQALLVKEFNNTESIIRYVDRELLEREILYDAEGILDYWEGVLEYFDLLVAGEGPDFINYAAFPAGICIEANSNVHYCFCGGEQGGEEIDCTSGNDCDSELCGDREVGDVEIDDGNPPTQGGPKEPIIRINLDRIWIWTWVNNIPTLPNPLSLPPYGGGGSTGGGSTGGGSTGGGSNQNTGGIYGGPEITNPFEKLDIVKELIAYIDSETDIELSKNHIDIISDPQSFNLLTFILHYEKENLSESEINTFITFLDNHVGYFNGSYYSFIESEMESYYLQHIELVTSRLDLYLPDKDGSNVLVNDLGRFVLNNFILGVFTNTINEVFNRLNYVEQFLNEELSLIDIEPFHLIAILDWDAYPRGQYEVFREHAYKQIAYAEHFRLADSYNEYSGDNFDVYSEVVDLESAQLFLAVSSMYESNVLHPWSLIEPDDIEFYLEMLGPVFSELAGVAVLFIPYGIGDAADIIQSCKEGNYISMGCLWAVAGVVMPFDELLDIWRHRGKFTAAWKTVQGYSVLKQAWKLIQACPRNIRTNVNTLESLRVAIDRGVKTISEIRAAIPNFTNLSDDAIERIFRGDGSPSGGLHHISGIINDTNFSVLDIGDVNAQGIYKAYVQFPSGQKKWKTLFPDSWNEIKCARGIRHAFNNKLTDELIENGQRRLITGNTVEGVPIEIITETNYNIVTAYPLFN